jgi:hypothetical protein
MELLFQFELFLFMMPYKSKGKSKGKVVPVLLTKHHAMEAYWGSGYTAPLIL